MQVRQFGEMIAADTKDLPRKAYLGGGIHPFAEIFYLAEGQVLVEWIGTNYQATAPAAFIIPANTPHCVFQISTQHRSWYIELQADPVNDLPCPATIAHWNGLQTEGVTQWPFSSVIGYTLLSTYEYAKETWGNSYKVFSQNIIALDIYKFFSLIEEGIEHICEKADRQGNGLSISDKKQSTQEQIYQMIRHMEATYTGDINLTDLSAQYGLTPSYIIRLFKESTGLTPMQYIQQLRLNAAISYLNTTNMPVQEIAARSGLHSLHYFSRLFKQKCGESPSQWRKRSIESTR